MGVSIWFLLSSLGFVILAQAQNCSKPLAGPNMALIDEDIVKDTFPDGSIARFKCDVGYTSAGGSPRITCKAGTWTSIQLICERKSCGSAPDVSNGIINYNPGNEFGDTASLTCNRGYKATGSGVLTCGDQGWMGRLPTCEVVKCVNPPQVAKAKFDPVEEAYNFASVVTYSCDEGYTLNGSSHLTCSENGNFSPSPPTCVSVNCKDPEIPNGEYVEGNRPPHGYKAFVRYRCKDGFTMKGSASVTCEINSQWSPGIPQCIKEATTTTKAPTTTTTVKITTTPSSGTKKPTDEDPKGGGNAVGIGIGIFAAVVILGVIIFVVYKRGKKGPRGDNTDKAAKDGEDLALAQA